MLINDNGLIRAINRAYKTSGYTVVISNGTVAIYAEYWFVRAPRALLSRKVLAAIVEHMGDIPEDDTPTAIINGEEPQLVLQAVAADDIGHWLEGGHNDDAAFVPVIVQGCQIFQIPLGGACWGVPLNLLDIINPALAERMSAAVIGDGHLTWELENETVVFDAMRKARSSWAKEWERNLWSALESIDLHEHR